MSLSHRFAREDAQQATTDAFETFWRHYPRRIGKGAARSSFTRAIRLTTLETMLSAIEAYKAHKPHWQDFCHPSTWLNQERWADEWATPETRSTGNGLMDALLTGRRH
jgi:hypothetical protein